MGIHIATTQPLYLLTLCTNASRMGLYATTNQASPLTTQGTGPRPWAAILPCHQCSPLILMSRSPEVSSQGPGSRLIVGAHLYG